MKASAVTSLQAWKEQVQRGREGSVCRRQVSSDGSEARCGRDRDAPDGRHDGLDCVVRLSDFSGVQAVSRQ